MESSFLPKLGDYLTHLQAFNIITTDKADFGSIGDSSAGIIFLSTPHGGSDAASVAEMLLTIFNMPLIGRFTGARRDSLQALEKGSKDLFEIAQNFRHWTAGLNIFSFVEQTRIQGLKKRVSITFGARGSWLIFWVDRR